MNKIFFAWMLLGAITLSANAHADATETVIGAAIGSATGAAIGKKANHGNNVVIWSALGGATGAYVGYRLGEQRQPEVIVKERVRYVRDDDYVAVRRPTYVVYEEPRYCKTKHYKHGHHHHHDRDDDD
jgi:hypothetical protein